MGIYILKRKFFTKYDDTDALKRAKDSDILAEKKRNPETGLSTVAGYGLAGAGLGAAAGGVGKLVFGKSTPASGATRWARFKGNAANGFSRLGRGAKAGALIGAGVAAGYGLYKRSKERSENEFYNNRLEYAQRQARRREKADWKANMTQRDGYSY